MKQLVELQSHAKEFNQLDAELIFVFREESKGVEGLKIIQEKHPTKYLLALDNDKKATAPYSSARMTFDNYVLDRAGKVVAIIDGTLQERATAKRLLTELKKLQ